MHLKFASFIWLAFGWIFLLQAAAVQPGIDVLFHEYRHLLEGRRVGLLSTQIVLDVEGTPTYQRFKKEAKRVNFKLQALFAPEHGFWAGCFADERIQQENDEDGLIIYTLYGSERRPSPKQLSEIDLMVIDLQDVGVRTYTYASSVFYTMEACAKASIPVLVLDRPNPINGVVVDGPCLEKAVRSFVGYVDVAFCHGMTLGELARYFNQEYQINCDLKVIPMKGWKRSMSYRDTHLPWLGSSPQIPDEHTPLYYAMTNIVGHLNWFSCGGGYSQPFRVVAHPDADAHLMARCLEGHHLPGVKFYPAYFKPYAGGYKNKICRGVRLLVTDPIKYQPFRTQMAIFETLRKLYPKGYRAKLDQLSKVQLQMLDQIFGVKNIRAILEDAPDIWAAIQKKQAKQLQEFYRKRQSYLMAEYLQ